MSDIFETEAAAAVIVAASTRRARRLAGSGTVPSTNAAEAVQQRTDDAVEHAAPQAATPAPASAPADTPARATTASAAGDVDPFIVAAEAFGFGEESDAAEPASAPTFPEPVDAAAAAETESTQTRRSSFRKLATAGATVGVMGIAGLLAVSMTLPASAVAAIQGSGSQASTSLVAGGGSTSKAAIDEEEIQAYVAPGDVQTEQMARADDYSTVSLAQVAAEEGIAYSNSVYTNDPDAAIQWPFIVGTRMSYGYGMRSGRMHQGIDLVPGAGAPIQAIADGTVRIATESGGGYGVTAYVDHIIDGQVVTSHYAHMQHGSLRVKAGDKVKVGDIIGKVGNTGHSFGAHLHFEILINGSTIDPLPWMNKNAGRYDGVTPIS
ncbi:M23 family metallopeptidase [Microbacterium sp.]|uniref:M23 family metallopeptidase n=1 Tax=Microbacterium sp. TaxID=51671 RepID=UPI002810F81F|nr:M23 family metallopeptidase [Microbacterium sp.]